MGDSVKSLAEIEVDNTHCAPLIRPANYAIVESYQVVTQIVNYLICLFTVL